MAAAITPDVRVQTRTAPARKLEPPKASKTQRLNSNRTPNSSHNLTQNNHKRPHTAAPKRGRPRATAATPSSVLRPPRLPAKCYLPSERLLLAVASMAIAVAAAGLLLAPDPASAQTISIRPSDFERLIMPCYLGGGSYGNPVNGGGGGGGGGYNPTGSTSGHYGSMGGAGGGQYQPGGRLGGGGGSQNGASGGYQSTSYYGGEASASRSQGAGSSFIGSSSQSGSLSSSLSGAGPLNGQPRDSLTSNLGQSVPRANTIENFIALVGKIEVANPRLANNPDQLIRSLLARFRLDNYYYDVRSRTPISEQDRRVTDILPALMGPAPGASAGGPISSGLYGSSAAELLPDHLLDHDERCSMYFMLSHFVDKTFTSSPALGQLPVNQLAGPLNGQKPPSLQAAGSGYPGASANLAYSGQGVGGAGQRYPGPSPSFGSPLTSQMSSFGAGISATSSASNGELAGQRHLYGANSPQQTGQYNSALANSNLRQPNAAFPGAPARPPYIDGGGGGGGQRLGQQYGRAQQAADDRLAVEYGVVTTANQENSAIVLNRVLLGMLAAATPPQSIRQLAALIYPTQQLANTPKLDEEMDPLYAVTLADLWAMSSIPKAGKPLDVRLLGDNGHWNDLMCPTSFTLERSSSIRFTTAELLGGLDGLNLGMFRRRLMSMRRNLRLSEMLRIYYSKTGFKPQYPDVGVCSRAAAISSQQDELHRQAENYLRLYQLSLPTSDEVISNQISRLDAFREIARQAANAQPDICLDSNGGLNSPDLYPMNQADTCEISRADVVAVLDASQQANQPFMQVVAAKLAQRLGLSRDSNSLSIMTNQQDTSGYAGAFSFNAIVRNSTNLGEIGCALVHDTSSSYQGGQITEPTRLMEMFERALVNLDSEYLTRQAASSGGYNSGRSSYVSSWFGGGGGGGSSTGQLGADSYGQSTGFFHAGGWPKNTGGAKIIVWFNYGSQTRPTSPGSGPTNWQPNYQQSQAYGNEGQEYRFYEAKKYLRENFRGAAILALAQNREDVKPFVYDEEHDIITDIAPAQGGGSFSIAGANGADVFGSAAASSSSGQQLDAATYSMLSGQADQLVSKLVQRMCTVPALFQYPMCFRQPSDNTISAGYISPGRKQYWMMSPKTFFASRSVRMVFKVDGGRLRVCFGRKPSPDETALRNNNQQSGYSFQSQSISFNSQQQQLGANNQPQTTQAPQPSSSDYYTGLEYGLCKDVQQNQEIDFLVSDPCYKKSIAECEPFYFVIRELSQPGEGDPNYMCRDEGCKRIDQAKFIMSHTGVLCNSAFKGIQTNWVLIMISTLAASLFSLSSSTVPSRTHRPARHPVPLFTSVPGYGALVALAACLALVQQVAHAQQQAGVYDFGQGRSGEKRGNFTPSEVLAIILIVMLILGGLAITVGLCYYVTKQANRGMQPVDQDGY